MIATEKLKNNKNQETLKKKNPRILFDPSENKIACEKISYILCNLGITPNLTGYRYLRYAIEVCLLNENFCNMKDLYKKLMKFTGRSQSGISLSMKLAIDHMNTVENDLKYELFPSYAFKLHDENFHITNVKFIEAVADYLRYHY